MEINIHEKELWVKLAVYKDCTVIHGQQNIQYPGGVFKYTGCRPLSLQLEITLQISFNDTTQLHLGTAYRTFAGIILGLLDPSSCEL
jgi:hypothetical protein